MTMQIAVIGSGIAGVTFAEEIHKLDRQLHVTLLTRETCGYYSRPLLSHCFSRSDIETKIVLKSFDALAASGITVESGTEVSQFNRSTKTLRFNKGDKQQSLGYDKLVLATGSDALVPPPFHSQASLFHVLNSFEDLVALRRLREKIIFQHSRPRWAVIGGGLIGCEISADLAKAGDSVALFHALPRLMERQLTEKDSATLLALLRETAGVEVLLDQAVQGFSGEGTDLSVSLTGDTVQGFNGIIVACGFQPRIEIAQAAGLETRQGIVVDECLATSDSDVYAIGDSAELPDGKLYAYVTPVRSQALWLAKHLSGQETDGAWQVPAFKPKAKVPGFEAAMPYLF